MPSEFPVADGRDMRPARKSAIVLSPGPCFTSRATKVHRELFESTFRVSFCAASFFGAPVHQITTLSRLAMLVEKLLSCFQHPVVCRWWWRLWPSLFYFSLIKFDVTPLNAIVCRYFTPGDTR
jgi:hypothetical protein